MADSRDPPVVHWGEELRRIIAARRLRRRRVALVALIGSTAVPLTASTLWKVPVLLVWNASASAPIGLYRVHSGGPIRSGDMVVAWTPEPARSLAARRNYHPCLLRQRLISPTDEHGQNRGHGRKGRGAKRVIDRRSEQENK